MLRILFNSREDVGGSNLLVLLIRFRVITRFYCNAAHLKLLRHLPWIEDFSTHPIPLINWRWHNVWRICHDIYHFGTIRAKQSLSHVAYKRIKTHYEGNYRNAQKFTFFLRLCQSDMSTKKKTKFLRHNLLKRCMEWTRLNMQRQWTNRIEKARGISVCSGAAAHLELITLKITRRLLIHFNGHFRLLTRSRKCVNHRHTAKSSRLTGRVHDLDPRIFLSFQTP